MNIRFNPAKVGRVSSLLTVILVLLVATSAFGQDAANGTATATVQTALAVTATNQLMFPTVFQGVATTMGKTNNDSTAEFTITGQGSAGINLILSLPEYLALADGSDRMTISFSATDANVDSTVTTPATFAGSNGWIDQNPRNLPAAAVIGSAGQTNVYLGGKVTPSTYQTAGTYTGDIILSVAYNGT